jgi:hypothetical protein
MSKTDLSGVWGFKGTSQLAKLTELQGYREKSQKNVKPPTPPCTEPLKRYVSSVLVQNLRRDGNIRLCPQHTQRRPSNSRERPRTIRSKFSPFWRNWVDSGVKVRRIESGGIHSHVSECTILVSRFCPHAANRNGENAK